MQQALNHHSFPAGIAKHGIVKFLVVSFSNVDASYVVFDVSRCLCWCSRCRFADVPAVVFVDDFAAVVYVLFGFVVIVSVADVGASRGLRSNMSYKSVAREWWTLAPPILHSSQWSPGWITCTTKRMSCHHQHRRQPTITRLSLSLFWNLIGVKATRVTGRKFIAARNTVIQEL